MKALSHPIRRGLVERLAAGPATVGVATGGFGVSKPAISKHLKVLEETGVVKRVVEGRTHRLSLEPDVLSEAADWMDRQRAVPLVAAPRRVRRGRVIDNTTLRMERTYQAPAQAVGPSTTSSVCWGSSRRLQNRGATRRPPP